MQGAIRKAIGCTTAGSLAFALFRSKVVHSEGYTSTSPAIPGSVELRCNSLSPACSNARSFFQQLDISCKYVAASPLQGDSIKAVVDGSQVGNVAELVDQLRNAHVKTTSVFAPSEEAEEKIWCKWAEEKLHPYIKVNIFRSPKEAKSSMVAALKESDIGYPHRLAVKHVASFYQYFVAKGLRRKLKVEDDRVELMTLLDQWVVALGSRGMMGGNAPNKADLAVFNELKSIEGLDAFLEISGQTGVSGWYNRVASHKINPKAAVAKPNA